MVKELAAAFVAMAVMAQATQADLNPIPEAASSDDDFSGLADPSGVVLAVRTAFPAAGGAVRIAVYANETDFLETALVKQQGAVGEDDVAVVPLGDLAPGAYAFVAYYDANGDGKLNRGKIIGRPKEPVAFSNGVKPKLRKPHFDEAKVEVAPGAVVVLTLEE